MQSNPSQPLSSAEINPLSSLDVWEDDLLERYPDPESIATAKSTEEYRNYETPGRDSVREFYRLNHTYQTYAFVQEKKAEFLRFDKKEMSVWDAFQFLNQLVDDSDPDTDLDQFQHLLQTSEAIRADGHPDWMVLAGLFHDMGKVLCLFGEPQWAVVGDTFPVGCAYSDKIVFPEFFRDNPDAKVPAYQTKHGIYSENCGLNNVELSWGHDEYMYHVVKDYLPEPAQYMIRYHSFYPGHREGTYDYLMNDRDREMFGWVRRFNPYDLYSKGTERPKLSELRPYYDDLVAEYFP